MASIKPLGQRVLVKRLDAEEVSAGGIVLPDTAQEKPQEAEVVALGTGGKDENGNDIQFSVEEGNKVLISKYGGTDVKVDGADLLIIGTRFRQPTHEDAKHITNFLNAGKPVIGIRTSTHAFTGGGNFGGKIKYGEFGPLIMGEGWVNHHGKHKREGARGIIEVSNAAHPILKGVTDVFAPSDVYGIRRLTEQDTILMRAAVTETLAPDSAFVDE